MLSRIFNWLFGDVADTEEIRNAIEELEEIHRDGFTAQLGQPYITDDWKGYSDPMIVVPLEDVPHGADQRLVFEIPVDRESDTFEFNRLLRKFGLDFDTMEEIAGCEVPIEFIGGSVAVLWDVIEGEKEKTHVNEEELKMKKVNWNTTYINEQVAENGESQVEQSDKGEESETSEEEDNQSDVNIETTETTVKGQSKE